MQACQEGDFGGRQQHHIRIEAGRLNGDLNRLTSRAQTQVAIDLLLAIRKELLLGLLSLEDLHLSSIS